MDLEAQVAALLAVTAAQARTIEAMTKFTPAFPAVTVTEIVTRYMRSVRFTSLAAGPVEEIRYRLHVLPALGDDQVSSLNDERLDIYRDQRRRQSGVTGDPTRPATRNREVRALSAALTWATKEKIIPHNPILRAPMEPEDNLRRTCPGLAEVSRIILAARSTRLRAMVAAKFYSGLRVSELLSLRTDQVVWDEGLIVLPARQAKGKKKGRVTILPEQASKWTKAYLEERADLRVESALLFCTDSGKKISRRNFLRDFQSVADRAKVEGAPGETLCLHDLRSGFVGRQIEINTPHDVIKEMLGDATESAFRRYVRVQRRWLIEARERTELAELRTSRRKPPTRAQRDVQVSTIHKKATPA